MNANVTQQSRIGSTVWRTADLPMAPVNVGLVLGTRMEALNLSCLPTSASSKSRDPIANRRQRPILKLRYVIFNVEPQFLEFPRAVYSYVFFVIF